MSFIPSSTEYAPAVRATLLWAGMTALTATVVTMPLVLVGLLFLVQCLSKPVSTGQTLGVLGATTVGGLFLYLVLRCTLRSAAAVRRSPGYPDRHWWFVRRAFRSLRWVELILLTIGLGLTAFAVFGRGPLATLAAPLSALVDAFFVYFESSMVLGLNDVIRHASVVPYFPREVGGIETFANGESLARHVAELDELAGPLGVAPLSTFGWNDDLEGEALVWHESAEGLKTVNALLMHLQAEEIAWDDHAGMVADLKRIAHALAKAGAQGIPFSLLLRHSTATSAMEWEARRGTCF